MSSDTKKMIEKILMWYKITYKKRVLMDHRDDHHWNEWRQRPVLVTFLLKKWWNGAMAYVEASYKLKTGEEQKKFWNSLWRLWELNPEQIIEKIEQYKGLDEITKDFMI